MKKTFFMPIAALGFMMNVYATDITIFDGGTGGTWGSDPRGTAIQEDQEVAVGCVQGQQWDLEAFTLDGNKLGMVGGYNFKGGEEGYMGGDIFIAVGSAPVATYPSTGNSANTTVPNTFGYDYAIDLVFNSDGTTKYNVYALTSSSMVNVVDFWQNGVSNPWAYNNNGQTAIATGNFTYQPGLSDVATGFSGGTHNVISGIDLSSFIDGGQQIWTHYTMECGNDNLMGHATLPVPEPGTLMLFGTGLLGLFGLGFFRRKK